jgi:hypothetical protein
MFNLVDNWESIEQHTRQLELYSKAGSYQVKNVKGGVEVKVRVGQFGFVMNKAPKITTNTATVTAIINHNSHIISPPSFYPVPDFSAFIRLLRK